MLDTHNPLFRFGGGCMHRLLYEPTAANNTLLWAFTCKWWLHREGSLEEERKMSFAIFHGLKDVTNKQHGKGKTSNRLWIYLLHWIIQREWSLQQYPGMKIFSSSLDKWRLCVHLILRDPTVVPVQDILQDISQFKVLIWAVKQSSEHPGNWSECTTQNTIVYVEGFMPWYTLQQFEKLKQSANENVLKCPHCENLQVNTLKL